MKKILVATLLLLMTAGATYAQNNFRGIVRFKLESSGKVDVQIKPENSTFEIKVFDNKLMVGTTIQNGYKTIMAQDLSPIISYLAANDIELESYTGDGKILIRNEVSPDSLRSLEEKDEVPGHFYYEYVDETQQMLGYTAKKMILHNFDDEGVDHPYTCWYTTEIGPEYCLLIGQVKGFPLVYTQMGSEGRAITYTATEVVKGKVKEAEFLPPAGYKDMSEEELEALSEEINSAAELLE
ncbi:MAG: hypothetical protein IJM33_03320 [Bacteroidales bacterium]|nr:hypothetical protein [Bacteroidales bacterium]MBR3411989.1 hypothetical protein [Bacteroidales bacterium]